MYNYYNPVEHLKPEEIIVYLRKSRADDPLLSVEEVLQKHEELLNEWAERNLGTTIPEENKFREVVSGETIADRPEVQRILKLIESPKIKAILIVEIQRLSRGDLEDAGRLMKIIRYTNTLVITPMKTFDLADEYDRDIFERELKRGNEYLEYQKKIMRRGKELSISQGNFVGQSAPYGYDKVMVQDGKRKCPTLAINEEQANVVRMIFDMYVNQGHGYKVICNYLNDLHIPSPTGIIWTFPTISDILLNVHYTGKVRWNHRKTVVVVEDGEVRKTTPRAKEGDYLIYEGKHPAIISEELFNAAQEKRGRNTRTKPNFTVRNPLAGLVYCKCGHALVLRRSSKKANGVPKYSPRLMCTRQTYCNTGSCLQSELLDFVENQLKQKIAEFDIEIQNNTSDTVALHEKMIKNLEKKLEEIQARELSQWEAQSDPDPAKRMPQHIFQMLNAKLLKEREETELAIKEAYNTMPTKIDYVQQRVTFQTALDALNDDTKSGLEKNNFLKACIKRIDYYRERPVKVFGSGNKNGWTEPPMELEVKWMV